MPPGTGGGSAGAEGGVVEAGTEAGAADGGTTCGPVEICGDGEDNDCAGGADDGCGGRGTFVSALTGDDRNPGTTAAPLRTIAAGVQAALSLGRGAGVYVAEGSYAEKVTLTSGVSLFGGFGCTASACVWDRDPSVHVTEIRNVDHEGVLAPSSVGRDTAIEGFAIVGLAGPSQTAPGVVALTVLGGAHTITRNSILGGASTSATWPTGRSVGIAVLSAPSSKTEGPRITANEIAGGNGKGTSIGILFDARPGTSCVTDGVVEQNVISGGFADSAIGVAAFTSDVDVKVVGNVIAAGSAATGSAWGVLVSGGLLLDSNVVNAVGTRTCSAALMWCGGVSTQSATAILTNNVILGTESTLSAGVSLEEIERAAGTVVLHSNLIDGASSGAALSASTAIRLRIGACTSCGFVGKVGRIRNNVLSGGKGAARTAVTEDPSAGRRIHPEALENNLISIAARGVADALYRLDDGAAKTTVQDLPTLNGLAGLGGPFASSTFAGNLEGDPMFDADLHLLPGSPCIDKGTATEAPAWDRDGEARPRGAGFDIGPDESP
ncbi:MAG: hypothetical protein FJ104_11850 [Deltaproteobacteria bacterium]|nr:hypothetical protein [Deltaproteobacteria bacterium]